MRLGRRPVFVATLGSRTSRWRYRHGYDSVVVDRFRYADDGPRHACSHKSVASLGHSLCGAVFRTPIGEAERDRSEWHLRLAFVLLMAVSFGSSPLPFAFDMKVMEGEAGEFPPIARKRVLYSPRPIGHDWVYSSADSSVT